MRTKRAAAALCFWLVAMPAGADVWPYGPAECNQLWFMRNLIMDRGGYCFGSPLGKSLFDNADCTGTDIALGSEQARQAKRIRDTRGGDRL